MAQGSDPSNGGQEPRLTDEQRELIAANETQEMIAKVVARFLAMHRYADRDELRAEAQDAVIAASRRFNPRRGIPFAAFAWYRVRGALVRMLRKRHRRGAMMTTLRVRHKNMAVTPDMFAAMAVAERQRLEAAVMEACARLPLDHARAIHAVYLEGAPLRQLGAELGMSHRAARTLLHDAVARLRFELTRRGYGADDV